MSLPTIETNINYIKCTMPDGKSIGLRKWKVRDEKELLFSIDSDDDQSAKIGYVYNFLKNLADNKTAFDDLSESGLKVFAIEARKLSKGDSVDYSFTCPGFLPVPKGASAAPKCNLLIDDRLSLTADFKIKNYVSKPIVVNDKLTITLRDLAYEKIQQINKLYISETKRAFYKVINSIDTMTIDGVLYTEYTPEEVEAHIDELDSNDLTIIINAYEETSSEVMVAKKVKCIKCGNETTPVFADLLSFLVL